MPSTTRTTLCLLLLGIATTGCAEPEAQPSEDGPAWGVVSPDNPYVLFDSVRIGVEEESWDTNATLLDRLLDLGSRLPEAPRIDATLEALPEERAQSLLARIGANRVDLAADTVREIDDPGLFPESMAFGPEGQVWVGGLVGRTVVEVAADGSVSPVFRDDAAPLKSVVGIEYDPDRGVLWLCTAATNSPPAGFTDDEIGTSELVMMNPSTGRVQYRYRPNDPGPHLFNDVEVVNGRPFLTDTEARKVYVLSSSQGLRTFVELPDFPNGITSDPSDRVLFVAVTAGIMAIDARQARILGWVTHDDDMTLAGIDGLYAVEGGFVAVQNYAFHERVVYVEMDESWTRAVSLRVLASGDPGGRIALTGAMDPNGEDFWYVSTTFWDPWPPEDPALPTLSRVRITDGG